MKILLFLTLLPLLTGCATVNFSALNYTPPPNYKSEVTKLWKELTYALPLKYKYSMRIVSDKECNKKGVPGIKNGTVLVPNNFVKYIYQNYYENRFIILTCLVAHELCHAEYNLSMGTPEVHFQTDAKAVSLLRSNTTISAYDYYRSMSVVKNYWYARKGVAGNALNVGWNIAQVASLVAGGPYYFRDWFAVDVDKRLNLISKRYGKPKPRCFNISKGPEGGIYTGEPSFNFFLAKRKTEEMGFAAYVSPADMSIVDSLSINGDQHLNRNIAKKKSITHKRYKLFASVEKEKWKKLKVGLYEGEVASLLGNPIEKLWKADGLKNNYPQNGYVRFIHKGGRNILSEWREPNW